MKKMIFLLVGAGLVIAFLAATNTQEKPWDVPEKYVSMKNPTDAGDSDCLDIGESLYKKHCRSCHGSEGLGDGSKSAMLDTPMPDLTTDDYKAQKAGVKYFQSIVGRDDMPNFEKKIPNEEDRWCLINYMDTF